MIAISVGLSVLLTVLLNLGPSSPPSVEAPSTQCTGLSPVPTRSTMPAGRVSDSGPAVNAGKVGLAPLMAVPRGG